MRRMTFLRTMVLVTELPTLESAVMPRVVVRQVVTESGKVTLAIPFPSAPVLTAGSQSAVSGNSLRTLGCTKRSGFSCARAWREDASSASIMRRLPASPWK